MSTSDHKHVLGVVGSPRRGGNTEVLIDEVLASAAEAGAVTEKVILSELEIGPCTACDACSSTGECVLDDDMERLLQKMRGSDVWVLGTPVYWWGPSAQFKAFVDRWYAQVQRAEDKAVFRGRRVVLVVPMGDSDPLTARHVTGMMEDALRYVDAELFAVVLAPGLNDPGEVRGRPDLLGKARLVGADAVGVVSE